MEVDDFKPACGGGDQEMMVTFELEAAETLACLAHSSLQPETDDCDADGDRRPRCDDNDLTPPDDGARIVVVQEEQTQKNKSLSDPEKLDDEQHQEPCCTTSYRTSGGRSRQPLTETEKEERRLRRVLANRESARQTIRRRQAMFAELTKRASDLALENENLKREKELAEKEYDSLKNTSNGLKEQIAKLEAAEAGKLRKCAKPAPKGSPASASTSSPFFPYDQPLLPIHWPSVIQPQLQRRSQNDNATPSVFPVTGSTCMFSDQRNANTIPNPGALVYVLPLPCFFPLQPPSNVEPLPQSSNAIEKQVDETHQSTPCSTGSSGESSLHLRMNRETHHGQAINRDQPQAGLRIPAESRHKCRETDANRTVVKPTPSKCGRTSSCSAGGRLNVHSQQEGSKEAAAVSVTGSTPESREKAVEAGAAAKARRRRRELMKLKSIHPEQFALN